MAHDWASMWHGTSHLDSIWLDNNPRVRLAVVVLAVAAVGFVVAAFVWDGGGTWQKLTFAAIGSGLLIISLVLQLLNFGPRIRCVSDQLWVRFGAIPPIVIPLDVVEVFFRGQEPVPATDARTPELPTSNVLIRIAERATDWHFREIPPLLGRWCGGYVVLRGLWCQPITSTLLQELNHRLVQAKRQASTAPVREFRPSGESPR